MSKYKIVDLFAGVGGLSLPFSDQEIVLVSEKEPKARQTYQELHGTDKELFNDDITIYLSDEDYKRLVTDCGESVERPYKKISEDFPEHDILLGGFPCQAFSIAGYRDGSLDKKGRGTLFEKIMDIVKEKQPKLLLLENVKNLYGHDNRRTFQTICHLLTVNNYGMRAEVLNAKDFGLHQNRERIYIVAQRDAWTGEPVPIPPTKDQGNALTHKELQSLLDNADLNQLASFTFTFTKRKTITPLHELAKNNSNPTHNSSINNVSFKFQDPPTALNSSNDGYFQSFADRSDWESFIYNTKTGHYKLAVDFLKDKLNNDWSDSGYQYIYQWRRQYVRRNEGGACPTLTANMGTGGHNVPLIVCGTMSNGEPLIRKLTPEECFLFQGFPVEIALKVGRIKMANSHKYKQAGNSVPVPVVKTIADKLMTTLSDSDEPNEIQHFYMKLSCPDTLESNFEESQEDSFYNLFKNITLQESSSFDHTFYNIPWKLKQAKRDDIVFLHIGGDKNKKKPYFEEVNKKKQDDGITIDKHFKEYQNGWRGVGLIKYIDLEKKSLTLTCFGLTDAILRSDLWNLPKLYDSFGPLTKGTPNQAGLYAIPNDIANIFWSVIQDKESNDIRQRIVDELKANMLEEHEFKLDTFNKATIQPLKEILSSDEEWIEFRQSLPKQASLTHPLPFLGNWNNAFYMKLSCPANSEDIKTPAVNDGTHSSSFYALMKQLRQGKVFTHLFQKIPHKLKQAKGGDIVFLHIGGDIAKKKRYFQEVYTLNDDTVCQDLQYYTNGWCAIIQIIDDGINHTKECVTGKIYPFAATISRRNLAINPIFLDNFGAITKGMPNQAGLHSLPTLTSDDHSEAIDIANAFGYFILRHHTENESRLSDLFNHPTCESAFYREINKNKLIQRLSSK